MLALNKNSTVIHGGAVYWLELIPAESLTQNPKRDRGGDKEQTKTNRATPAEPRTP